VQLEVAYQHPSDVMVAELQSASVSTSPNIINDYVGGQRPPAPRSSLSASLYGAAGGGVAAHPFPLPPGVPGGMPFHLIHSFQEIIL